MAVQDLHTLDISKVLVRLFDDRDEAQGAILRLTPSRPQISKGSHTLLTMGARAKGALVEESGAKPDNGRQVITKPFVTTKLVYSQRVSDEFLSYTDSEQVDFIGGLVNDWLRTSLPVDIDTVVAHGVNPFTGNVSTTLTDYITKAGSSIAVPSTGDTGSAIDTDIATAAQELTANGINVNGIAIAPTAAAALSNVVVGSTKKYPEAGVFGLEGGSLAGRRAASSAEIGEFSNTKLILGDWRKLYLAFAGSATWRVHTAGDPDNTGRDLAGHNEVLIRLEEHFGFRVLDANAFAWIGSGSVSA